MPLNIQKKVSLKKLTTFEVGGKARFFTVVRSQQQAIKAIKFAKGKNLPIFMLGGGSNVVVSDQGFKGLVIKNEIRGCKLGPDGTVVVAAGENWDEVVAASVSQNLAGIECLSGIPGTAGGAVVQNIGAYGQTLADVILEVRGIKVSENQEFLFAHDQCEFKYRNSLFKRSPGAFLVTTFRLKLKPQGVASITYPDVREHFNQKLNLSLAEVRKAIIEIRARKGYVIMSGYECYKTAGSFFKNPVVSKEKFQSIKSRISGCKLPWFWELPNNKVKLSAACLLQETGFAKGYRQGKVGISPKHSLSIVNLGKATASEIKNFAQKIKDAVKDKFGIMLEEEVLYVGDFKV